jgi:hypothetical protein
LRTRSGEPLLYLCVAVTRNLRRGIPIVLQQSPSSTAEAPPAIPSCGSNDGI